MLACTLAHRHYKLHRHIEAALGTTGHGKLIDKGLIDELIQDYQFVQRLGMKHLKDFVYERWLQRWREPHTSECDGECREHLEEEALVEYFTRTWGGKLWSRAETPHGLAADNNIPERTNEDGKFFLGHQSFEYAVQAKRVGEYLRMKCKQRARSYSGIPIWPFHDEPKATRDMWVKVLTSSFPMKCLMLT